MRKIKKKQRYKMLVRVPIIAVYKGDEFIDVGTAEELAERLNLSPSTILWQTSPSARRRFPDDGKNLHYLIVDYEKKYKTIERLTNGKI